MEALAGRDRSQTARQMLTAPGERRIVGDGEVEAHHPEQRVQESFGLAQRKMVEESQGQGGFDGKIRVPPLPTPPAAPAGRPGSDRFRGQPHRHIAAPNEGPIVGRPIRHAVLRLIRGMNLRLHPCSVAPAETRRAGQTAPPAEGLLCNNAVYEAAGARGATVVVPPRSTANVSRHGPRSSARDHTILAVKEIGRRRWKQTSGYHGQARVENAFFRYKSIIGDGLRACSPAGRGTAVVLACSILNQMTGLGRPISYRIDR